MRVRKKQTSKIKWNKQKESQHAKMVTHKKKTECGQNVRHFNKNYFSFIFKSFLFVIRNCLLVSLIFILRKKKKIIAKMNIEWVRGRENDTRMCTMFKHLRREENEEREKIWLLANKSRRFSFPCWAFWLVSSSLASWDATTAN